MLDRFLYCVHKQSVFWTPFTILVEEPNQYFVRESKRLNFTTVYIECYSTDVSQHCFKKHNFILPFVPVYIPVLIHKRE